MTEIGRVIIGFERHEKGVIYCVTKKLVDELKTLQGKRKHAHWETFSIIGGPGEMTGIRCSECKAELDDTVNCDEYDYCPFCGAVIDGGEDHESL